MSRAVDTASSLVTSNDQLVGSMEGIECIMIESMYHNAAGNLRRAWLTTRRAMGIAQMMGLQRGSNSTTLKVLDPERRSKLKPMHIWFRVVQSDRYFSLVLGLPQGVSENSFATSQELEACTPIERMQRIDCVAAGRILQRNATDLHDLATTMEIDRLLQNASATLPPQWWLTPDLSASAGDEKKVFLDTVRLMDQCTHYTLLGQLHLPYMLRFSVDSRYDYSKITAVNASREVLTRFITFRSINRAGYYCRGLDFLAFIASTVLCLAHINSRDGGVFGFLAHQRSGDRGMMERALESIESMARENMDDISSKLSGIFQHLLAIESDVANGGRYSTDSSSRSSEGEVEYSGDVSDGGRILNIHIPYFGTVKIERGSLSRSSLAVPTLAGDLSLLASRETQTISDPASSFSVPKVTYPTGGSVAGTHTANSDGWKDFLSNPKEFDSRNVGDAWPMTPDISARAEEWALQGVHVDIALFDQIIQGMGATGADDGMYRP